MTRQDAIAVLALDRHIERVLGPIARRPWVTVEEAGALLGVGRSSAYEAVKRGELPATSLGRRRVVPTPALVAVLLCAPEFPDHLAALTSHTEEF
jgi:excisionase family DNA binding protein